MTPPVKVFALEWHGPMMIRVLVELATKHGWLVQYCTSFHMRELFKQHFPAAVYHETHDARHGRPPLEFADLPWSGIDQPTAEVLGYNMVLALKQMDREEIMGGFATHDRFLHFHRLMSYWSAVFDRLRPDVLVMPTAPHVVYDYLAYSLAKLRGIKTVMFEYVTTEGLLMAIDRFEDGLPPLTAAYRKCLANPPSGKVVLSDRMEKYWRRLQDSYNIAIPRLTREVHARADAARAAGAEAKKRMVAEAEARATAEAAWRRAELRRKVELEVRHANPILRLIDSMRGKHSSEPLPPPELPPLPPPSTTDGHYHGRFYAWTEVPDDLARKSERYRTEHLEAITRRYEELAEAPDLKRPYVYVALHHQPERSSNPIGGIFDDQDVMIGMIASTLPDGWCVYVKEHPTQLAPQIAHERGRWVSFYDAVVAHRNVKFVPLTTSSFDLIDNARTVATITGTSSWEALARGVPTLVFGEAWYKGCPGSHTVRTTEDCRRALEHIAAGERPDAEAVRLFLKVAEDASFVGYLGPEDEPIAGIDEVTNIGRLTQAIVSCYASSIAEAAGR